MLGPLLCGQASLAPLLPKLRGHFAEFLGNASPAGLGILSPSTCVGLRYGRIWGYSGFSRQAASALRYFCFAPRHAFGLSHAAFTTCSLLRLYRAFHPRPASTARVPASSAHMRYRNLRLFPIGYASLPRLRPRLPQGRQALPWNPWIFGREDSHLPLATHSGILPPCTSTAPSGTASLLQGCSPTGLCIRICPAASAACLSPGHFRRRGSRLVSCYALFECMAASEPTS